ncbi:MAG: hypothetical protein PHN44_08080 [Candidatus Marinimicrobia bacterium]|nr:hypothetical protein [Candidatus Neomarinimicrobiota bacterium]
MTKEKLSRVVSDIAARKMALLLGQFSTLGSKPIFINTILTEKPVWNVHSNLLYDERDDRLVFSVPITIIEVEYFEKYGITNNKELLSNMRNTLLN